MLSAYRQSPTVLPLIVELTILRSLAKNDVSAQRLGAFVSSRLPSLINAQKLGEICWLLFLCISLKIAIKSNVVAGLFDIEDGAVALLLSDADQRGLVSGKIERSAWNRSLTSDGLDSSMWLYSYESTLKKLIGVSSDLHVTRHRYFGPMYAKKIEFYRSSVFHLNQDALLRRLRLENLRRRIQEDTVGEDLGKDLLEFDISEEELMHDEDEMY